MRSQSAPEATPSTCSHDPQYRQENRCSSAGICNFFHIWGICPKSAWCHSSISLHGSAQYICSNLPPKAIAKVRGFIFFTLFPDVNFLARLRANFSPGATCFFRSGKYYPDKHGRKRWCPCRPCLRNQIIAGARGPVELKGPGGQAGLPGDRFLLLRKGTALKLPGQRENARKFLIR